MYDIRVKIEILNYKVNLEILSLQGAPVEIMEVHEKTTLFVFVGGAKEWRKKEERGKSSISNPRKGGNNK